MRKYYDISRRLADGTAVWPGDTSFRLENIQRISQGASVNLTTLHMSAHTGTHVDAPCHFDVSGSGIAALDPELFWGRAQVFFIKGADGPLTPGDLQDCNVNLSRRLLLGSTSSFLPQTHFPDKYVYPTPELADYLAGQGIILLGVDGPSMDHQASKTLDGHKALQRNGIAILEWLDLSAVPAGIYELAALPLKIVGGDGSPVRAVLRSFDQ